MSATWISAGYSLQQTGLHNTNKRALSVGGKVFSGVVRESVQNALDAKRPGASGPVEVDFKWIVVFPKDIPGVDSFRAILDRCERACKDNDRRKVGEMKKLLAESYLPCLRIGDHNTIGLPGAATDDAESNWHRLIREQGTGAQGVGRNGSHGVGKLAPFSVSQLRTVFYSSMDEAGFRSHIGVSRLCSYPLDEMAEDTRFTDGVYYCQEDEETRKRLGRSSIEGLAPFEKDRRPDGDSGTDLYVMGLGDFEGNELRKSVLESILQNFLFSIAEGTLVVDLPAQTGDLHGARPPLRLDAGSLRQFVEEFANEPGASSSAVRSNRSFLALSEEAWQEYDPALHGEAGPFAKGDFKFKFVRAKSLHECIVTRSSYMALESFDCPGTSGVIGILTLTNDGMIELFRRMEDANHQRFVVGTEEFPDKDERARAKMALRALKEFVASYVRREFATEKRDRIRAAIPERLKERFGHHADTDITDVSSSALKAVKATPPKKKGNRGSLLKRGDVRSGGPGGGGVNKPGDKGVSGGHKPPKPPKDRRQGATTEGGDDEGFSGTPFPVSPRVVQLGARSEGRYRVVLTMPETAGVVKVRFQNVGETGGGGGGGALLSLLEAQNVFRDGVAGEGISRLPVKKDRSSFMLKIADAREGEIICFDAKFDVDYGVLFNILYSASKRGRK